MAYWTIRQRLAVFYLYLIGTTWASTLPINPVVGPMPEGFKPVTAITKRTDGPRLEVSNIVIRNSTGKWTPIRVIRGPLIEEWLGMHANGHANTTVMWLNGTMVSSQEATELLKIEERDWGDSAITLGSWDAEAIIITNAGIALFSAVAVTAMLYLVVKWLTSGKSLASATVSNPTASSAGRSLKSRAGKQGQRYVYMRQSVGNDENTAKWPSSATMQHTVHSALQDMADHDYADACYELGDEGQNCELDAFANLGFCSWDKGGHCVTPACEIKVGQGSDICN